MKEKTLLKLALISSFVGIAALFFISDQIKIKQSEISELEKSQLGSTVKIIGKIERISESNKTYYLTILNYKPEKVTAVVFRGNDALFLSEGDEVELTGTLEEYKGEMQIISDNIKRLN